MGVLLMDMQLFKGIVVKIGTVAILLWGCQANLSYMPLTLSEPHIVFYLQ